MVRWWHVPLTYALVTAGALIIMGLTIWAVSASESIYSPIPKRFLGSVRPEPIVWTVPLSSPLLKSCGKARGTVVSCQGRVVATGRCAIFVARELTPQQRWWAIRHERANCNGWNDGR